MIQFNSKQKIKLLKIAQYKLKIKNNWKLNQLEDKYFY